MSSFLCSSLHVATIAAFSALDLKMDPLKIARALRQLNNSAMRRYGERPQGFGTDYPGGADSALRAGLENLAGFDTAADRAAYAAALCDCLDYQCADNHPAYKTLARIHAAARELSAGKINSTWSI